MSANITSLFAFWLYISTVFVWKYLLKNKKKIFASGKWQMWVEIIVARRLWCANTKEKSSFREKEFESFFFLFFSFSFLKSDFFLKENR